VRVLDVEAVEAEERVVVCFAGKDELVAFGEGVAEGEE
jgi:hypothetical protein